MEQDVNNKKKERRLGKVGRESILLFVYTVLVLVEMGRILGATNIKLVFTIMMLLGFFIIGLNHLDQSRRSLFYFTFCYIVSFGIIVLSCIWNVNELWLAAGWSLSILINPYIGMLYQMLFSLLYAYLHVYSIEQFGYLLMLGVGVCFLVPLWRKKSNICYSLLLGVCLYTIYLMCQYNFVWDYFFVWNTLLKEVFFLVTVLFALLMAWMLKNLCQKEKTPFSKESFENLLSNEETNKKISNVVSDVDKSGQQRQKLLQLERLMQDDFPLQVAFKENLPERFVHCKLVAELAGDVAEKLGLDEKTVYAAALYHEIGKLNGKDYIKENKIIAREYGFPENLITIMNEHSAVKVRAKSKEGSIVMLADSVVSVLDQLKSQKKDIEKNTVTKQVIGLRLEKGILAESTLTLKEYNCILHAFVEKIEKISI